MIVDAALREVLDELINCAEGRALGPNLAKVEQSLGAPQLKRTSGHLLLFLMAYVVPVAAGKVWRSYKEIPNVLTPLRFMIAELPPIAALFEASDGADLFRVGVSRNVREAVVRYVHQNWHPVIETVRRMPSE